MQSLLEIDKELLVLLNGSSSMFIDNLSLALTSGLTWIPLYLSLLYIIIKNTDTMKQILLIVGCVLLCITLSEGITDFIVKPLVGRLRPSYDPLLKYSIDIVNGIRGGGQYCFFSAHAANTFGLALFFSLLIRDRRLTFALFVWTFVNGWTRIYLGLHYPFDVLVGFVWGMLVGLVAYAVYIKSYLRMFPHFNYVSSQYTLSGYNRSDVDVVLFVLSLTLFYSIIKSLIFI